MRSTEGEQHEWETLAALNSKKQERGGGNGGAITEEVVISAAEVRVAVGWRGKSERFEWGVGSRKRCRSGGGS